MVDKFCFFLFFHSLKCSLFLWAEVGCMIRLIAMKVTKKTFLVRSKVDDLFHDCARGFGLYALNDCGLGCSVDLRGTYLGES